MMRYMKILVSHYISLLPNLFIHVPVFIYVGIKIECDCDWTRLADNKHLFIIFFYIIQSVTLNIEFREI